MARIVVKNGHPKDMCHDTIGLWALNIFSNEFKSNHEHNHGDLYDHLERQNIHTTHQRLPIQ
jgi:hypothetical protein